MTKVYNKSMRTFCVKNTSDEVMLIKPLSFATIPDSFEGDITFNRALAAGDLAEYNSMKEADAIEEEANKTPRRRAKKGE